MKEYFTIQFNPDIAKGSNVGVVFSKPNERRNYSAWPNVARLSEGRLMAVWSGNRLAHTDP